MQQKKIGFMVICVQLGLLSCVHGIMTTQTGECDSNQYYPTDSLSQSDINNAYAVTLADKEKCMTNCLCKNDFTFKYIITDEETDIKSQFCVSKYIKHI